MKEERLLEIFGDIDSEFILEAEPATYAPRKNYFVRYAAMAAGFIALFVIGNAVLKNTPDIPHMQAGGNAVQFAATADNTDENTDENNGEYTDKAKNAKQNDVKNIMGGERAETSGAHANADTAASPSLSAPVYDTEAEFEDDAVMNEAAENDAGPVMSEVTENAADAVMSEEAENHAGAVMSEEADNDADTVMSEEADNDAAAVMSEKTENAANAVMSKAAMAEEAAYPVYYLINSMSLELSADDPDRARILELLKTFDKKPEAQKNTFDHEPALTVINADGTVYEYGDSVTVYDIPAGNDGAEERKVSYYKRTTDTNGKVTTRYFEADADVGEFRSLIGKAAAYENARQSRQVE